MTQGANYPHVLLSGPLSVGKTTLATGLALLHSYEVISARATLRIIAGQPLSSREELQAFGGRIEGETHGRWLADFVAHHYVPERSRLVVDALRTQAQVQALRAVLAPNVLHLHLTAGSLELSRRFDGRHESGIVEAPRLELAMNDASEADVDSLKAGADAVIETTDLTIAEVAEAVSERLLHRGSFDVD